MLILVLLAVACALFVVDFARSHSLVSAGLACAALAACLAHGL